MHRFDDVDFKVLARELCAVVRGRRSAPLLSRRLGFRFNQVIRWERGQKSPSWTDFVALCRLCGANLEYALALHIAFRGDAGDCVELLKFLTGQRSQREAATLLGVSEPVFSRWLNGVRQPDLEHILRMINAVTGHLHQLVVAFAPIESFASLSLHHLDQKRVSEYLTRCPEATFVMLALGHASCPREELSAIRFLQEQTGLRPSQIKNILTEFERLRVLSRQRGTHLLELRASPGLSQEWEARRDNRLHFIGLAADRLASYTEPPQEDGFGSLQFIATRETYKRILERYIDFYREIELIAAQAPVEGDTSLYVFNMQIFGVLPESRRWQPSASLALPPARALPRREES